MYPLRSSKIRAKFVIWTGISFSMRAFAIQPARQLIPVSTPSRNRQPILCRTRRSGFQQRRAGEQFILDRRHMDNGAYGGAPHRLKKPQTAPVQGFLKFPFASVIRKREIWQPAGQRSFPFTPYNTSKGKIRLTAFVSCRWRLVFSFQ